jgi:hypothetical protein
MAWAPLFRLVKHQVSVRFRLRRTKGALVVPNPEIYRGFGPEQEEAHFFFSTIVFNRTIVLPPLPFLAAKVNQSRPLLIRNQFRQIPNRTPQRIQSFWS